MSTSSKILILLLFLVWIAPGLIGRDPWKADEPYSLGMVNSILRTGDWVVPAVAGEPFLEKPPLYYVTAAAAVRLFSPPLAPPDAARLVNIFWLAVILVALGRTAQELSGSRAGWTAPVLLMGSFLLQVPAHKLLTDIALLAGFSLALSGLAVSRRLPEWGGFWTGTGVGIGFLAKGLIAPGAIGLTILGLAALDRRWRTADFGAALTVAILAALPWLVIWPTLLFLRSPDYFTEWFLNQNFGRFIGFGGSVVPDGKHTYYLSNILWLGAPWIFFAGWSLWNSRNDGSRYGRLLLPLVAFAVLFAILSMSASSREIYTLPLLLPIALIAADGLESLPHRTARLLERTFLIFFSLLGSVLWGLWLLRATGNTSLLRFLPQETVHYPPLEPHLLATALLCTLAWVLLVVKPVKGVPAVATSLTGGVALAWGLAMTLWLPWLEGEASYRNLFSDMANQVTTEHGCINSYGLGESERAMVEYFAGLRPRPLDERRIVSCDLLLLGNGVGRFTIDPLLRPSLLWEGKRPAGHPKELYALYRVSPPPAGRLCPSPMISLSNP